MSHVDDIAAVVLAAGGSTRMGRPKALLPLGAGHTFLSRVVTTLVHAGVPHVVVVTRREWSDAAAWVMAQHTAVVINTAPERGQFSSLQCGLAAVPNTSSRVLITLVDVPLTRAETVRELIRAQRLNRADVVRPERAGRHGHPVLVTRAVVDTLLAADPGETARSVLRRFTATTVDVPVADDGAFVDVDTPEDYDRVLAWVASEDPLAAPDEG
jgi:molybdenum cofactor cytidylyltransferase